MEYRLVSGGGDELEAQMNSLAAEGWHFSSMDGLDVLMERSVAGATAEPRASAAGGAAQGAGRS